MLNGVSQCMWAPEDVSKSSAWRELSAVHRVLQSFAKSLRNSKVKCYPDNAAVCDVVLRGNEKGVAKDSTGYFFFVHTTFNSPGACMVTTGIE